MRMRPFLSAVSLALLLFPLPGQTAAFSPTPQLLFETVGPDGWRVRLGPTNLGSLLESEKGHELWQPSVMPLLGAWQHLIGDDAAYAAAKTRLLGYGGRIRLGCWLSAKGFDRLLPEQLAITFEADGRTELAALAGDLRQLQDQLVDDGWSKAETDLEVDDGKLAVFHRGEYAMTAPLVGKDLIVITMASTERMAAAISMARAFGAPTTGRPPAPTTPAMHLQLDLAAVVAMAKLTTQPDEWHFMQALGLESLGQLDLTVGTAGPSVRFEVAQGFHGGERGVFGAFFPASQGVPSLRACAPTGPGSWKVGHFDFGALYTTIEAAVVASREADADNVRTEMKKELGVDVADDLVAHMTDEVLLTLSPLADLDSPQQTTWTLTVRLRDEAKFAAGFNELLRHSKPFLSREDTEKVGEVELHRYGNMFGYDLWVAVGNGVLVLAGGRDAEPQASAVLTSAKALAKAAPATAAATDQFANLQRYLPPGCNGLSFGDVDSLLAMPSDWWLFLLGEMLPMGHRSGDSDPEQQAAARQLLREHGLGTVRSASGYAEARWCWRLFW